MKIRILKPITLQYPNALIIPLVSQEKAISVMELQSKCKKGLEVEFKPYSERRTLSMNAYLWVLCDKIAKNSIFQEKRGNPMTAELYYKECILQKGVWHFMQIVKEAYEEHKRMWERLGEGNQLVMWEERKGSYIFKQYYGSSCYNKEQMSILIDYIISQAEELGIETLTPKELEKLKAQWGNREE